MMNDLVTKTDLALALETFELRLTIRVGGMIAAAVVAMAALQRIC